MKTCIECGWRGDEKEIVGCVLGDDDDLLICPRCDGMDCIQGEIELHLWLNGWERLLTINRPARFARAVSQSTSDFITGAPVAKELARVISAHFRTSVKVIDDGQEIVIDEF